MEQRKNMKPLFVELPAFKDLEIINGLFDIDLSADEIWEQGKVPEHA